MGFGGDGGVHERAVPGLADGPVASADEPVGWCEIGGGSRDFGFVDGDLAWKRDSGACSALGSSL